MEEGLGTCWIGAFNEARVKKVLKVPKSLRVVCLLPIGKPAEAPEARSRKPLAEFFFENSFGNPLVSH